MSVAPAPATGAPHDTIPDAPSRTPQRVLAAALLILLMALREPPAGRWPEMPFWPGVPAAILAPGLFHADEQPQLTWLAHARPDAKHHLPRAALTDARTPENERGWRGLTCGFLALLLAAHGLCAGRGVLAVMGRVALGVLILFLLGSWIFEPSARHHFGHVPRHLGLPIALLAGAGLLRLGRPAQDGRGEGAAMALGAVAVLLAAVLIALSLQAGAVTDARVVRPLLDRIEATASAQDSWRPEALARPEVIAANAAWLRVVLDRAALAAFVSMCVLLLHLKSRGTLTGILVVLVVAADLLSVRLLL